MAKIFDHKKPSFWARLFGGNSAQKSLTAKPATTEKCPTCGGALQPRLSYPKWWCTSCNKTVSNGNITDSKSNRWEEFFDFAQIHENLRDSLRSFVGSWPSELDPKLFGGDSGLLIIRKLHSFISGSYPGFSRNGSPEYKAIDGNIARASNKFLDLMICGAVPKGQVTGTEPHAVMWDLIQRHSRSPLARLLFTLPQTHLISQANYGRKVLWVVKDGYSELFRQLSSEQILRIQLYTGVENAIFGAYKDLPEGGYLTDAVLEQQFRSLLR